jgi:hypothetical protein
MVIKLRHPTLQPWTKGRNEESAPPDLAARVEELERTVTELRAEIRAAERRAYRDACRMVERLGLVR